MGRALLIIVAGLTVVLGLIQTNMQIRQNTLVERSAKYINEAETRNIDNAAIDLAIEKLENDPGWRNGYQPWAVTIDNGSAQVTIDDYTTTPNLAYNQLKITAISTVGSKTITVVSIIEQITNIPTIPSAMGFYGDSLSFNANGTSFLINGYDKNIDGSNGSGAGLPGIVVGGQNAYDSIYNSLAGNPGPDQRSNITGTGASDPSLVKVNTLNGSNLQNYVDSLMLSSDQTIINGNYDGMSFGTDVNPLITVVDGNLTLSGSNSGAGVIIVKQGSTLDLKGNLNFNGIIIVQGQMSQSSGNVTINGSLLFGSSSSAAYNGAQINGNMTLNYSTQALNIIQNGLSSKVIKGYKKLSVYE